MGVVSQESGRGWAVEISSSSWHFLETVSCPVTDQLHWQTHYPISDAIYLETLIWTKEGTVWWSTNALICPVPVAPWVITSVIDIQSLRVLGGTVNVDLGAHVTEKPLRIYVHCTYHRIMESPRLDRTSKIIQSNGPPTTSVSLLHVGIFWTSPRKVIQHLLGQHIPFYEATCFLGLISISYFLASLLQRWSLAMSFLPPSEKQKVRLFIPTSKLLYRMPEVSDIASLPASYLLPFLCFKKQETNVIVLFFPLGFLFLRTIIMGFFVVVIRVCFFL